MGNGGVIDVAIGVLVRDNSRGCVEVLISQRLAGSVLGGYWEFPGGKIAAGETPGQCIVREFEEELGIKVRAGDTWPMIEHTYAHGHVRLYPLTCKHVSGEPRNVAVAQHRWVGAAELPSYRFPAANRSLVDRLSHVFATKGN